MIAIVAPATEVKAEYVHGAAAMLRECGYKPVIAPHCLDAVSGTYAAPAEDRLDDFLSAWHDPRIKAILCARGGYGCVQIIADIPGSLLTSTPKWVIGFSDVSALHALLVSHGVASLHAGMAKHLHESQREDLSVRTFLDLLAGKRSVTYTLREQDDDIIILNEGVAEGQLRGGNFAVLNGLAATPYDLLSVSPNEDVILFLEDIGEGIYEVDRMLWRLHLSGSLHNVNGLIFCSFNSYRPDKNHPDMEHMIAARMQQWGIEVPVVLNFPVGHVDGRNLPMVEGSRACLTAKDCIVEITQDLI